jgi:hypothetical protein
MTMDLATLQQQLPQLEFYCDRLYNAQVLDQPSGYIKPAVRMGAHPL